MLIIKKLVKKGVSLFQQVAGKICVRSDFLSTFYYSLLSNSFYREHRAVLSGKWHFSKSKSKPGTTSYLLRRNVHRIEKGLIAKPFRDVFAKSYIVETVQLLSAQLKNHQLPDSISGEQQWAYDVLTAYFSIVGSESVIDKARSLFEKLPVVDQKNKVPYKRKISTKPDITFEQILELSKYRRSVRWYRQEKVPRGLVDKAIKVASYAPSACNRQPFKYLIFDNKITVSKISAIPMGTTGFSNNFPGIIVLVGDLSAYPEERDRHLIYIDGSLSAMAFMYALETLGVGSCAINWPDIREKEKEAEKVLNLKKHQRIIMFISYGYPDPEGLIPYSEKKPLSDIREYLNEKV
jgi:nitroreductase